MTELERIRVEIGFSSGQMLVTHVPIAEADELVSRLKDRADHVVELQGEEGVFLVAVPHISYVKRFTRESRVGFGNR